MKALWSLPGPQLLLTQIAEALHAGRHVLLQWPPYAPDVSEVRRALANRLLEIDSHLQRLSPPVSASPLPWLTDHFELPLEQLPSRPNLLEHTEFQGCSYWLDLPAEDSNVWLQFTAALADDTNNLPVYRRALLVVPFSPALVPPTSDAGLTVLCWDDHYDETDAVMLAHHVLRPRYSGVTRSLLANMAVQVALYDVPLLLELLEQDLGVQLDPQMFLKDEARRRGWDRVTDRCSTLGTQVEFGGQPRVHSLLKVGDDGISRRIWRAQASVLLLHLEEARQRYIKTYDSDLVLPFTTPFGEITDPKDLELAHLYHQARHHFPARAKRDLKRLQLLRDARHALSHLDSLSSHMVTQLLELG